jgi:hypothetical protein
MVEVKRQLIVSRTWSVDGARDLAFSPTEISPDADRAGSKSTRGKKA